MGIMAVVYTREVEEVEYDWRTERERERDPSNLGPMKNTSSYSKRKRKPWEIKKK